MNVRVISSYDAISFAVRAASKDCYVQYISLFLQDCLSV